MASVVLAQKVSLKTSSYKKGIFSQYINSRTIKLQFYKKDK